MALLTITVPSGLARFADELGKRRVNPNLTSMNNLARDPDHDLWMDILGARGEAALYWFFGGFFGGASWPPSRHSQLTRSQKSKWRTIPDVIFRGVSYDAKGVDRNNLSLLVFPDTTKPDWKYVLVGTQFWPDAEMLGWALGSDILSIAPEEKVKGRKGIFVKQNNSIMHSCLELPTATPAERIAEWEKRDCWSAQDPE